MKDLSQIILEKKVEDLERRISAIEDSFRAVDDAAKCLQLSFDEFAKLAKGDKVGIVLDHKYIRTTCTGNAFYNHDCDEPGWEVETDIGTISADNIVWKA